jgi:hypothetical protein
MNGLQTSRKLRLRLLAALCVALLAAGVLAPHGEDARISSVPPWQAVAETTTHPDNPAHWETPAVRMHPGCPACLVQLESRSLVAVGPLDLPVLDRGDLCAAPPEQRSIRSAPRLSRSRAPPLPTLPA